MATMYLGPLGFNLAQHIPTTRPSVERTAEKAFCFLGLSIPRRTCLSRGGPIYPEAGLSLLRRAYSSRGRPIHPEAGLSVPRRAYLSRGGPIYSEAGLRIPRWAYLPRGGPTYPEAGLSIPRQVYSSPGGPIPSFRRFPQVRHGMAHKRSPDGSTLILSRQGVGVKQLSRLLSCKRVGACL
jgi:hypothetical protein